MQGMLTIKGPMTKFKPDGWQSVTPRLIVSDAKTLIEFLRAAFDAKGEIREGVPSEIRIDDSIVIVSDGGGVRDPLRAFVFVFLEDADATFRRALNAGAECIGTG
jgi:PhnB protein